MDVAELDEAQSKKIFRARKTMKISDRQQLGSIHNSNSSTVPTSAASGTPSSKTTPPAVMNGKCSEADERTERESNTDKTPKGSRPASPVSRTPSPLTLSLSLSPSPPSQSPKPGSESSARQSPPRSPDGTGKVRDGEASDNPREKEKEKPSSEEKAETVEEKKTEGGEREGKEDGDGSEVKDKENEKPKPDGDGSPCPNSTSSPASPSASEKKNKEESKTEMKKGAESEGATAMETDLAPPEVKALEGEEMAAPPAETTASTSPSLSPSHAPESDLEVKEGFLVLSEEDDNQGEKDLEKEEEEKEKDSGDGMEVDAKSDEEEKGGAGGAASPSPNPGPAPPPSTDLEPEKSQSVLSGKKRALCGDAEKDGEKDGGEDGGERDGKRQRVEGEELEAQLELKITANTSSRLKLEKVVQQLVEEQLRVLQLSVFDRSLQELKDRVEKIDCATKHQQTLNSLQAKIARLTKKFGAANQTSENMRKTREGTSHTTTVNATPLSTTSSFRSVRTPVESKQPSQNQTAHSVSATASPAQPKPLSTPTPPSSSPMVSAPVPLLLTTAPASDAAGLTPVSSHNQPGAVLLKTTLAGSAVSQSGPTATTQAVTRQPLLIQLPLTVANGQGGGASMELIPVSSLGTVGTLTKAKTTSELPLILQKAAPSSSTPSLPSSPAVPQITVARAVYPPGSGIVSVPSSGASVSTARTPSQSASVAGVSSSSSLPVTSAPAATGGQATAGPPSATVMASKTDNQATNSTGGKTFTQASRAGGSRAVIDLTEDDDDVQVTGVQKAPVQSNAASTSTSATQHSAGAPPQPTSSSLSLGPATGSSMRSSPQSGPNSATGPNLAAYRSPQNSPSNVRTTNPNVSPHQLPPLPSPPPAPSRLPPEATHTTLPQRPQLKLTRVQNQNGIVLSWGVDEPDRTCAAVDSYHLYAYHRDHAGAPPSQWKKIGEVKALPLPMACTLTQFVAGSTYYFAICARDIYSRFGPFCEPQCTDVINTTSSG